MTFELRGSVLVGRDANAQIRLDDGQISRRHATLRLHGEQLIIRDLGSRHGTFVDGHVASESPVPTGSVIRVGTSLLLLVDDIEGYGPIHRLDARFLGVGRDVWASHSSWRIWQHATRVASLTQPVLILGESGSGKEATARLIHASRAQRGPFVAVNVAAIPEGLFESELFGHVRGAFTGASGAHLGAFRAADRGVLFLDELGDLRLDLQAKLLRAIDQMCVRPVGGDADVALATRVIAATSRDLERACLEGSFRSDLYYRLSGIELRLAPLRERRDEILLLAEAVLAGSASAVPLSVQAAEALLLAPWPGNVRQLENVLTQATVNALTADRREIALGDLPATSGSVHTVVTQPTAEAIARAFRDAGGNARRAADALGISRAQLYKLLARFELDPSSLRGRH